MIGKVFRLVPLHVQVLYCCYKKKTRIITVTENRGGTGRDSGCIIPRRDGTVKLKGTYFLDGTGRYYFLSARRDGKYSFPRWDGTVYFFFLPREGTVIVFPRLNGAVILFFYFPTARSARWYVKYFSRTAGSAKASVPTQTFSFSTRGPISEKCCHYTSDVFF